MGFTLPRTRLAFKNLRPLFCQRLGPPATLTTWVSTFYVRLTNSLDFQDMQSLLESLLNYIMMHHHKTFVELRSNHEAPLWAPSKRVMELRPDHETPPLDLNKRFMELRSDHEAPPWDLTKRFRELRPRPYQNHVSKPNIKLSCIPISCPYL